MLKNIIIGPQDGILELGPGTGPFTELIQKIIPHPNAYLAIERENQFIEILKKRFPQLNFIQGSAEDASSIYQKFGIHPIRAIISSLPFASLPHIVQTKIIDSIYPLLSKGSTFRTFQYVHAYALPTAIQFRKRMQAILGPCHISALVIRNIPPAFVLTWQKT